MRRGIPQLVKKPGTALVLSGGGTKAFYFHLGVLRALGLEGVTSIVGTSAGAVAGALLATGNTVDQVIASVHQREIYAPHLDQVVKSFDSSILFHPQAANILRQSAYTGIEALKFLWSLPRLGTRDYFSEILDRWMLSQNHVPGFFSASSLESLFKSLLPSNDFRDAMIDLYVTATRLDGRERGVFNAHYGFDDGENAIMDDVPIHKAVRASVSIPGLFEPMRIHDRYYIDGEIKQTLSVDIGAALADRIIVSHTYQPLYRNDGSSLNDMGWLTIFKQAIHIVFHERIRVWRELYENTYPDKEFIWIHPDSDDAEMFFAPEFSFRREVQHHILQSGETAARKVLQVAVT